MNTAFAIAVGGAVGALLRHFVNNGVTHLTGGGFPWGILACNVVGSFAMGLLVTAGALFLDLPQSLRAFLAVGLLGAFTTFSAFSLDTVLLIERGALGLAAAYVLASVTLSIAALFLGMWLVRALA